MEDHGDCYTYRLRTLGSRSRSMVWSAVLLPANAGNDAELLYVDSKAEGRAMVLRHSSHSELLFKCAVWKKLELLV